MKDHTFIDRRSLALARAIADKVDQGHAPGALTSARDRNRRWREQAPSPLHDEWAALLRDGWSRVRTVLLDASEAGARLRQNNPFCGVLTPRERWAIYRKERDHGA